MADNPRIDDLRRRVQKDPASIAFAQLAEEYRRAGEFAESVEVCRTGLAIHPTYLSARVTLGRALIELGQLDAARAELETVLRSAPENLAAIRGVAEIHQKQGALAEALSYYKMALTMARNDPELEQTVADLSRRVAPQPRAEPADGMSFEQMRRELKVHVPPAPGSPVTAGTHSGVPAASQDPATGGSQSEAAGAVAAAAAAAAPPTPVPVVPLKPPADPERARAERTISALEEWLDAIHGTRSDPHT